MENLKLMPSAGKNKIIFKKLRPKIFFHLSKQDNSKFNDLIL